MLAEHIEHKSNFAFAHAQLQETLVKHRKHDPATQKYTNAHTKSLGKLLQQEHCRFGL